MIDKTCPVCNKIYLADPVRLKHGRQTTCGRECSYILRASKKTTAIKFNCVVCDKEIKKAPSTIKSKHGAVFCSPACHYAGRSTGATKRIVINPYTYTPESKARMVEAVSKPKGQRVFHMLICAQCSKQYDDPSDGRKRKTGLNFCSVKCCNEFRTGANNPAWRGGYPGYYGKDWRGLRRAALNRDNHTCQRCFKVMTPPARRPDVHHIKPVGTFVNPNDANYLQNVICLCHSCHMFVEKHGL